MPYSIVHIKTSINFLEWKNLDKNDYLDFLAWSLLPDCSYNLYSQWVDITRDDTHYHPWEDWFTAKFPANYNNIELPTESDSYFVKWYYHHLLVDEYYRDNEWKKESYDEDMKCLYEIYRKINAYEDLLDLTDKSLIEKLYNYKIDKSKLPSIFIDIDVDKLQNVFIELLDHLKFKKRFIKYDTELNYYHLKDNKIIIKNDFIDKYNKYFSREEYLDMINNASKIDFEL